MSDERESSREGREQAREAYLLGRNLFAQGRYPEAEKAFLTASDTLTNYADIHHCLGVIAHLKTDFKAAIASFRKALEINPRYTEALLNLAITYNTVGLYDKASALFEKAAMVQSSSTGRLAPHIETKLANLHAELGSIYHDHFVYPMAIEQFERALELCPRFVDIRFKLGLSLRDFGKLEEAIEQFQEALKIHTGYHAARGQLGFCLLKLGRREEARKEFQAVLDNAPDNTLAKVGLSKLQEEETDDSAS